MRTTMPPRHIIDLESCLSEKNLDQLLDPELAQAIDPGYHHPFIKINDDGAGKPSPPLNGKKWNHDPDSMMTIMNLKMSMRYHLNSDMINYVPN